MPFQITPLTAATISAWAEYETGYIAGKSGIKSGDIPKITSKNKDHLTYLFPRKIDLDEFLCNFVVHSVCDDESTGYFGVILINEVTKQIVLVHRPTNFKLSLTDNLLTSSGLQQDIDGIFKGATLKHEVIAFQFCKHSFIPLCKDEKYSKYSLNITGHSLAAWLAQMSTLYCHVNGIDSVQTITFDGPGAKEAISRYAPGFDPSILSIINFLSQPNLVNAAGSHVGDIRALPTFLPPISEEPSVCCHPVESKKDMVHATYYGHDFMAILPCLVDGFPKKYLKVEKWPSIKYQGKAVAADTTESSTARSVVKFVVDVAGGRVDYGQLAEYYKYVNSGVTTDMVSTIVEYRICQNYQTQFPNSKIVRVTENTILQYLKCLGLKPKEELRDFEVDLANQFVVRQGLNRYFIEAKGSANIEEIIDKALQLCRHHNLLTSYYEDTPFVAGYYQKYRGVEINYGELKKAAKSASDDTSPYKNNGWFCCNSPFDVEHALKIAKEPLIQFLSKIHIKHHSNESIKVAVDKATNIYEHKEGMYFKELFKSLTSYANHLLSLSSNQGAYYTNEPVDNDITTTSIVGLAACTVEENS